jgi:hypothetical protein
LIAPCNLCCNEGDLVEVNDTGSVSPLGGTCRSCVGRSAEREALPPPSLGRRVATLGHALVTGALCLDDTDVLRSGATSSVLSHHGVMAPSTLDIFLRSFTFGHVRQLGYVSEICLRRAWSFGATSGDEPMTLVVELTICEAYGAQKQGGFLWLHPRGWLPPAPSHKG